MIDAWIYMVDLTMFLLDDPHHFYEEGFGRRKESHTDQKACEHHASICSSGCKRPKGRSTINSNTICHETIVGLFFFQIQNMHFIVVTFIVSSFGLNS